eukprot:3935394-Rhodomonas_salina.1
MRASTSREWRARTLPTALGCGQRRPPPGNIAPPRQHKTDRERSASALRGLTWAQRSRTGAPSIIWEKSGKSTEGAPAACAVKAAEATSMWFAPGDTCRDADLSHVRTVDRE